MLIKLLIGKLIRKKVVCLFDFDGEMTLAFERHFSDGTKYAYRLRFIGAAVILQPDGTATGKSYVKSWRYA